MSEGTRLGGIVMLTAGLLWLAFAGACTWAYGPYFGPLWLIAAPVFGAGIWLVVLGLRALRDKA